MEPNLAHLRAFVEVADAASFTAAAARLGLARSRVSASVQQLEAQLGTRLLQRTTRTVRITPDGELLAERARALLADADELGALFQRTPASLRGRVRVDAPLMLAAHQLIPALPAFLAAHPALQLELSSTDRRVDLVHEGYDCVLRVGALAPSELVARPLGRIAQANLASAGYLAAHGTPRTLADLAQHRLVHYAAGPGAPPAGFEHLVDGALQRLAMPQALAVNNSMAYRAACLAGLGIVQAPTLSLQDELADGRVVEVLPAHAPPAMPVTLLYAHRRQLPRRVAACMDWIAATLAPLLLNP